MKHNIFFLNMLHILNDGYFACLILILPFLARTLHLSLFQAGILGGLTGLMGILLALPAGHVSIKWGGMKVLLTALSLYSVAYMLLSIAFHFYLVFFIFLLASFGFSVFHPVGFGLIAKFANKKTRGAEIGKFTAIGDIGKIGISAVFTFLIAYIGWRSTSFFYGIFAGITLLIILVINKRNPRIVIEEKSKDLKLRTLLSNKRFLVACITGTLDVFASFPIFIFLPFLLLEKGFSTTMLGALVGAYFVGNLLGKTLFGRLTDRYGSAKIFVATEALMAICIVLLASSNSLVFIVIYSIILGMLTKGTVPVVQTMVSDAVEHHGNFEKSISVYSMIANTAVALSPLLLGIVSDKLNVRSAFIVSACFAVSAIFPALLLSRIKHHE